MFKSNQVQKLSGLFILSGFAMLAVSASAASVNGAIDKCKLVTGLADGKAECKDIVSDKTTAGVEITTTKAAQGDAAAEGEALIKLETECMTGCPDGVRPNEVRVPLTGSHEDWIKAIKEALPEEMKKFAEATKKEEEKARKEEACLIADDGKERSLDKPWQVEPIMTCRAERYEALKNEGDDGEKAAEYYDKYLREKLQSMLEEGDPGKIASTTLAKLHDVKTCPAPGTDQSATPITPVSYVKGSVCNLNDFSKYKTSLKNMDTDLDKAKRDGDSQLQDYIAKAAEDLKIRMSKHFSDLKIDVKQQGVNPFTNTLTGEIDQYQAALDSNLKAIQAKHLEVINAGAAAADQTAGKTELGRTGRGQVTDAKGNLANRPATGLEGSRGSKLPKGAKRCKNGKYRGAPKIGSEVSC